MTADNDNSFPSGADPLSPTPWWAVPVLLVQEAEATMSYLTKRRAMDLLKAGRFAEAREAFDGLLASAPTDVNWLLLKGVCLLELGDYQAALAPLTAAERLAPWDPDVLLFKADTLLMLREYAQAEQALTQLLADDPEHSRGRYRLACWAALTGKPHRALHELRRLVDEDSGFREEAAADPSFAGLRRLPAFRKLIAVAD